MRKVILLTLAIGFVTNPYKAQLHPNDCNATVTSGNEIPCGDAQFPCCQVYNACNGTATACNNYDPDFSETSGCDLSCAPIDSGVLFLLFGGAAFGGAMIARSRRRELLLEKDIV